MRKLAQTPKPLEAYPLPPPPVSPLHQYFPPWPSSGSLALQLATLRAGDLIPIPYGSQPLVLPTHELPPSGLLFFRLQPGVKAVQIQQGSWPCRKIVFSAPSGNLLSMFMGTVGVQPYGSASMELPPGSSGTIDVADVILIYFVAQNATDIITGWAESNL